MKILNTEIANAENNEVYPQVIDMGLDYDWDAPDSVTHMIPYSRLHTPPRLESFHLDPATRATDVISQSYAHAAGLLVSEPFWWVLRAFTIQPHQILTAGVVSGTTRLPYRWIHIAEALEPRIEYSQSEFEYRASGGNDWVPSQLSSEDELRALTRRLVNEGAGALAARRITFDPATPRYDLFCLQLTSRVWFVSEELAARLHSRGLTGFELLPSRTDFVFR
ncbi:MAG TPA: hypothetical protein VMA77_00250 [Solirubrobacteraceae bacterium]|nr:hypothetical protein [Solirubrobacteraceae bacterium]